MSIILFIVFYISVTYVTDFFILYSIMYMKIGKINGGDYEIYRWEYDNIRDMWKISREYRIFRVKGFKNLSNETMKIC